MSERQQTRVGESGDTETSTDSGQDAVDATDVVLGFRVDGLGIVEFYIDRILVATHTTNIPTANLAPAVFHLSGNATGTKSSVWTYLFYCMSER